MIKKIKDTIMSEQGSKFTNAVLLSIVAAGTSGIFGLALWGLSLFIDFSKSFSESFRALEKAQIQHILHEKDVNSEQDLKIDANTLKNEHQDSNIKDIKEVQNEIKSKIGGL